MNGSRWARSDITFGPVGRVITTLLLLVPVWWFGFSAGIFGLVGLVVWCGILLPCALRDVWRAVPRPLTDEELLQRRVQDGLDQDAAHDAARRESPRRW